MSQVTNVILTSQLEEDAALTFVNAALREERRGFTRLHVENAPIAGTRTPEMTICIGAFNFLDLDNLISVLRAAEWRDPESIQLFVCGQQEYHFHEINIWP